MAPVGPPPSACASHGPQVRGSTGAGKTRLSATFPAPFFLDLESGSHSARPDGVDRIEIETDANAVATVRQVIKRLKDSPFDKETRRIHFRPMPDTEPIPVGTVAIDSIDVVQQTVKMLRILNGRTKMELEDWDTLLNELQPMALEWGALPVRPVAGCGDRRQHPAHRKGSRNQKRGRLPSMSAPCARASAAFAAGQPADLADLLLYIAHQLFSPTIVSIPLQLEK